MAECFSIKNKIISLYYLSYFKIYNELAREPVKIL
jgi:hypothetical protein